jgi:hypothetical protein
MTASEFLEALSTIEEIDLTVTGRKSGRTSPRPVWFMHEQGKLYLLPVAGSDTSWYKNVLVNPTLQIALQGKRVTVAGDHQRRSYPTLPQNQHWALTGASTSSITSSTTRAK